MPYIDPGYVLDNWEESVAFMISNGIKIIFTGHYHANDITRFSNEMGTIYDFGTGSPVSNPLPSKLSKHGA